ncbi:hypothetical protein ACLOJK_019401 [Asimina triloba]
MLHHLPQAGSHGCRPGFLPGGRRRRRQGQRRAARDGELATASMTANLGPTRGSHGCPKNPSPSGEARRDLGRADDHGVVSTEGGQISVEAGVGRAENPSSLRSTNGCNGGDDHQGRSGQIQGRRGRRPILLPRHRLAGSRRTRWRGSGGSWRGSDVGRRRTTDDGRAQAGDGERKAACSAWEAMTTCSAWEDHAYKMKAFRPFQTHQSREFSPIHEEGERVVGQVGLQARRAQ